MGTEGPFTRHASLVNRHSSPVTCHTSHVARQFVTHCCSRFERGAITPQSFQLHKAPIPVAHSTTSHNTPHNTQSTCHISHTRVALTCAIHAILTCSIQENLLRMVSYCENTHECRFGAAAVVDFVMIILVIILLFLL